MTKLSVLTTVWAAYDFVWPERRRLFLLAFPPVMTTAFLRGLVFIARGVAALAALVVLVLAVFFSPIWSCSWLPGTACTWSRERNPTPEPL